MAFPFNHTLETVASSNDPPCVLVPGFLAILLSSMRTVQLPIDSARTLGGEPIPPPRVALLRFDGGHTGSVSHRLAPLPDTRVGDLHEV